jgi:hypothetical protein
MSLMFGESLKSPSSRASDILAECKDDIEQHLSKYGSVEASVESLMTRLSSLAKQISSYENILNSMTSSSAGGDDRRVAWYIRDDLTEMNKLQDLLLVNLVKHE